MPSLGGIKAILIIILLILLLPLDSLRSENRFDSSSMPDFDIHFADLIAIKCKNAKTMRLNACLLGL